jgi:hypothetical protein
MASQGFQPDSAVIDSRKHESLIRAQQIVELRVVQGIRSWREIGEKVGMSYSGARKLFNRYMDQMTAQTVEEFKNAREIELMRLDGLWKLNFDRARDEELDPEVQQRASITCLRISESRRKLMGVDAAEKHEVYGSGGGGPLSFDLSGMEGDALERDLAGYFNPGDDAFMDAAAEGFLAGLAAAAAAESSQEKSVSAGGKIVAKEPTEDQPEGPPQKEISGPTVFIPDGFSQGEARI